MTLDKLKENIVEIYMPQGKADWMPLPEAANEKEELESIPYITNDQWLKISGKKGLTNEKQS